MKAALQAALGWFRGSRAVSQMPRVQEVQINLRPGVDAGIVKETKELKDIYKVAVPGASAHTSDVKTVREIVKVDIDCIKLSSEIVSQRIVPELKAGKSVRLCLGSKTLTSTNPLVEAFRNGPGNGHDFNNRLLFSKDDPRYDALPEGDHILFGQSARFIRAMSGKNVKFTKVSEGDRRLNIHCSLLIEPVWN